MSLVDAPEPGQLVEVRQRPFVVQTVTAPRIPIDPLRAGSSGLPQHLVSLSSVEDDALGDELQVIWELEPGARVRQGSGLPAPDGFDDPVVLDAFLDAARWGAISSADLRALQAPFRSGIAIEDYQLDPVVRAIQMPRVNLLVADDVGLGKTIEAGLVAQELILRHRVHTILIVCPSAIQMQWRDQMRDKFGLEFRIVDSTLMRELRRKRGLHANPWTHFPRLITSIDYLKRERPLRLFREVLPGPNDPVFPRRFDLLIVDEAHNAAPAAAGRYATDSDRTHAVRALVPHFEHKLFLSATPHNGYPESFGALLELLDNQRFARGVRPDRDQLGAIMVRRLKTDLEERWDGSPRFPPRRLAAIEVPYTEAERRAHRLLHEYTTRRQKGSADAAETFATEFVHKLLKKRLFSSPAAFAATLAKHEDSVRHARKKERPAGVAPSLGVLRRQIEGTDEEFADDDAYTESTDEALSAATRLFRELTPEEAALLGELRAWAGAASARPDAKAAELMRWLDATLRPGGEWGAERVIIFTEYRETQKWLAGLLAANGFTQGNRLMMLYGGMDAEDRERIKAAFQAGPDVSPVRILLATDAASEGIDLQNHCARLIHYEIPWNPNRMEQRNGRIDRHGQRAPEVLVYHFVGADYNKRPPSLIREPGDLDGDLEFLLRAARKVETIREDLGKVGPVIAAQVEEAMLGKRSLLDTAAAEREAGSVRSLLRVERRLREQMKRLYEQLKETEQDLRLAPENVEHVVSIGLQLAGQPPLLPATVAGLWPDPSGRRRQPPVFHMPALKGSWAACSEGLRHPHTGVTRPIVFDHALARDRDDVVLVHLGHRLVQMCLRLLRAEVWSPEGQRKLHRVTARVVPDRALETPAVIAHGRLVVLGADGNRLHEEVISAGGVLRAGRFARLNVGEVKAALDAALPFGVPDAVQQRLAALWPGHAEALDSALRARMSDRTTSLARFLQERAEKEMADKAAILGELRQSILNEMHEPEQRQLALFSMAEQEQVQRNLDSLRRRVDEIPAEIKRERQATLARYAAPKPHLFPVAVTYLVPESIARQEGDTREVGLDQMVADGHTITRAVPSRKWPGTASLEVAHVWVRRGRWSGPYLLDDAPVAGITPFLARPGTVQGTPYRLAANAGKSFQGSIVLGMGFVLAPEEAQALLDKDPRNRDVLFPYLNGEDLNSRPDQSPSRWVINYHDWPLERAETYPDCKRIVREKVKPERDKVTFSKSAHEKWWQYERARPELYTSISPMKDVLVCARVSAHHFVYRAPVGCVFADRLAVLSLEGMECFAVLSSSIHDAWAHRPGSTTHETRNTYFPESAFETFPFPPIDSDVQASGTQYENHRRSIMLERQEGLRQAYNRFHNPDESSEDVVRLRELHVEMDYAVAAAYGWNDLDLDHGFHQTKQGLRYTISEEARREVLGRLLALNHERYREEVALGLHDKGTKGAKGAKGASKAGKNGKKTGGQQGVPTLFDEEHVG